MDDPMIERLADLAVNFGAKVQPEQILIVNAELGQERVARAVTAAAYRAGAHHVEVAYADAFGRRSRIEHGVGEAIGYAPPWQTERIKRMGEERVAVITLDGSIDPAATDGLDPARVGADQSPVRQEYLRLVVERLINWCIIASPNEVWAAKVHPDMQPAEGLAKLWSEVMHVCRLDEDDPVGAWNARMSRLSAMAERLSGRRFDAITFRGPGTDLTVGLLPTSNWMAASFTTAAGLEHHPNLPTEEVFTTPDPERVNGVVRSTKPLDIEGTLIEGLTVRFEGGRAVSIDADCGTEVVGGRRGGEPGGG
jgi:aminopeptidase